MAGETVVTVVGNLTADPELRVTTGGQSVLACTIASTPRVFDRDSGQWKHAAESFGRGTSVIVHGKLTQREFETRKGENHHRTHGRRDRRVGSVRDAGGQEGDSHRRTGRTGRGSVVHAVPADEAVPIGAR